MNSIKRDIKILEQLYKGNHLNGQEIRRASLVLHSLTRELEGRNYYIPKNWKNFKK